MRRVAIVVFVLLAFASSGSERAVALSCAPPEMTVEEAAREMPYVFEAVALGAMDRETGLQAFRVVETHKGRLPDRVTVKNGGMYWGADHQPGERVAFALDRRDGRLFYPACPQFEGGDGRAVIEALGG